MRDITKEYVLKLIDDGIARHGSQASYERAAGLNKQAIKDIRRSKKCPPADIWQKIAREAGLEKTALGNVGDTDELNDLVKDVNVMNDAILDRLMRIEKRLDLLYFGKKGGNGEKA